MAEKPLGIAKADKKEEFAEINALTNPTIKKYYLEKFAQSCDSAAVHLKAAALPGQKLSLIHITNYGRVIKKKVKGCKDYEPRSGREK